MTYKFPLLLINFFFPPVNDAKSRILLPQFKEIFIIEREKHKETDEYKRAIEEEWASRLRQLQIQV